MVFTALTGVVANLINSLGADALSLTMNTVALLLILDLDNFILSGGGLSHSTYKQVADEFRMELDQRRVSEAYSARYVHILGMMISIHLTVYTTNGSVGENSELIRYFIIPSLYQFFYSDNKISLISIEYFSLSKF